jgi:hypothetical protein
MRGQAPGATTEASKEIREPSGYAVWLGRAAAMSRATCADTGSAPSPS